MLRKAASRPPLLSSSGSSPSLECTRPSTRKPKSLARYVGSTCQQSPGAEATQRTSSTSARRLLGRTPAALKDARARPGKTPLVCRSATAAAALHKPTVRAASRSRSQATNASATPSAGVSHVEGRRAAATSGTHLAQEGGRCKRRSTSPTALAQRASLCRSSRYVAATHNCGNTSNLPKHATQDLPAPTPTAASAEGTAPCGCHPAAAVARRYTSAATEASTCGPQAAPRATKPQAP
mmetsp:Transcript_116745/g.371490  ORF Transcript_116745/g.371490 Transcript_116745/m.371490 type:complete len:238 (-) Transcript_116745:2054-2767(-)